MYNNNSVEHVILQKNLFEQLNGILNGTEILNTIIIGDFNSDLYRNSNFDKLFGNFIEMNELITIDLLNTQLLDYTFHNQLHNSQIDHILITKSLGEKNNYYCNILNDTLNTSDHLAISLTVSTNQINNNNNVADTVSYNNTNNNTCNVSTKNESQNHVRQINWTSIHQVDRYKLNLLILLSYL